VMNKQEAAIQSSYESEYCSEEEIEEEANN
jgi:hypothetical protein